MQRVDAPEGVATFEIEAVEGAGDDVWVCGPGAGYWRGKTPPLGNSGDDLIPQAVNNITPAPSTATFSIRLVIGGLPR